MSGPETLSMRKRRRGQGITYFGRKCEGVGESGEDMMSVCGEKGDSRLPEDDLRGASRAMAR